MTAHAVRISDWSSDVCSSALHGATGIDLERPVPKHNIHILDCDVAVHDRRRRFGRIVVDDIKAAEPVEDGRIQGTIASGCKRGFKLGRVYIYATESVTMRKISQSSDGCLPLQPPRAGRFIS